MSVRVLGGTWLSSLACPAPFLGAVGWTLGDEVPDTLAWSTSVAPSLQGYAGSCCALTGRLDSNRKCPYSSILCQASESSSENSFQVQK